MTPPILLDIQQQILTERLLLRCPKPGDGVAIYPAVQESLADLRVWSASLPWVMSEPSVAASETFCRDSIASFVRRDRLTYLIFDRITESYIGCISLQAIDWKVPKCEIGYWCRSKLHRQGFVTEAAQALLAYAMQQLHMRRIAILVDEKNIPSRRVCEALGMTLEGIAKNERIDAEGEMRDTCVYALIR